MKKRAVFSLRLCSFTRRLSLSPSTALSMFIIGREQGAGDGELSFTSMNQRERKLKPTVARAHTKTHIYTTAAWLIAQAENKKLLYIYLNILPHRYFLQTGFWESLQRKAVIHAVQYSTLLPGGTHQHILYMSSEFLLRKKINNKWELYKDAVQVKTIFLPKIKLSTYSAGGETNSIL